MKIILREKFENDLSQLHEKIIQMGTVVKEAINAAVLALETCDIERCKEIINNDKEIDELEKTIESKCLRLIARQQPVASDLRTITTALKIITDLERIGDHAADIAEITIRIQDENNFSASSHITEMASTAVDMLNNAIKAYVESDLELAKATEDMDDYVDDYFNVIKQELILVFSNEHQGMDNAIDYLLAAKYLERIADHAVNICEWIHFSQTGEYKHTQIF